MKLDEEFFSKYHINIEAYNQLNIDENELMKIFEDYTSKVFLYDKIVDKIADSLRKVESVHSIKYRTKDPEHLIEKVIRKAIANKGSNITLENYSTKISDLIGVRVLHLYKDEWAIIHKNIINKWSLIDIPVANVRDGDHKEILNQFRELGCTIHEHENGYRSVHYTIQSNLFDTKSVCEIQVRTIFEEGWSEIDHRIRYPYHTDSVILREYLEMFNRLAGNADEMGTFVKKLSESIIVAEDNYKKELKKEIMFRDSEIVKQQELILKREQEIEQLRITINELKVTEVEKELLQIDLQKIQDSSSLIEELDTNISMNNILSKNVLNSVVATANVIKDSTIKNDFIESDILANSIKMNDLKTTEELIKSRTLNGEIESKVLSSIVNKHYKRHTKNVKKNIRNK